MMSSARDTALIVGIAVLLPLCSIQHFIWPLSWCLLADICNHTWIPECGYDELMDSYRLFIDECDMFEYNCDHETDYEVTNYSLCFGSNMLLCPKPKPCPSRPTCPDHRYHRMGDRFVFLNLRRQGRRMLNPSGTTPPLKMQTGKRRYTPEKLKRLKRNRTHYVLRTRKTTPLRTRPRGPPTKHTWPKEASVTLPTIPESVYVNQKSTKKVIIHNTTSVTQTKPVIEITVVLKSETIRKNGKIYVKKVVKKIKKYGYEENKIDDSDFIE